MTHPVLSEPEIRFPAGFLWGAATAAHQVEGHLHNDWEAFEQKPGAIAHGDRSTDAFDEDFALAEQMGHNAHRLSFEWARIEPARGVYDPGAIAHYHAMLASMKAHGLTPLVTLHHFTNPVWVAAQGGWLSARTVQDFADYAAFMGREFGAEVDWWVTLNEPNVYAFEAYQAGVFPPAHHDLGEALRVMANLAHAHALAYRALHRADRVAADCQGEPARVGIAQHVALFDPYHGWNPIDWFVAHGSDEVFNRAFLVAATAGRLDFALPLLPGVHESEPEGASALDFIGVNYYTRWRCTAFGQRLPSPGAPTNGLGWELYPEGLYRALSLANEYTRLPDGRRIPLLVTENGIDDRSGDVRSAYLVQHLAQVARAIRDGMDVRGYLHWTLMDNFEWAEGYAPRFGLFTVDRAHGLARRATPTVAVFREIARANSLSPDLLSRYGQVPLGAAR